MREGRTPLPAWAFILVGASMMVYSKFIETKAEHTSLAFFFYLGLGVILVGLGKIALKRTSKKEEKTLTKEKQQYQQSLQERLRQQELSWTKQQAQRQQQVGQYHYITCSRCKTPNFAESQFCAKCGQRLR